MHDHFRKVFKNYCLRVPLIEPVASHDEAEAADYSINDGQMCFYSKLPLLKD